MSEHEFVLRMDDVSPQSYRALQRMVQMRGNEPLRDALLFIVQGLRFGDVTIRAEGQ